MALRLSATLSWSGSTKTTGLWTLYWRDRNLKYHRYKPLEPSSRIQDLLDYLDSRADPIFWG